MLDRTRKWVGHGRERHVGEQEKGKRRSERGKYPP